jgi:hypothetical protein
MSRKPARVRLVKRAEIARHSNLTAVPASVQNAAGLEYPGETWSDGWLGALR